MLCTHTRISTQFAWCDVCEKRIGKKVCLGQRCVKESCQYGRHTTCMKSGDSETKELVCDKHSEKAAAPCPAESAESKQVARAAYDAIDSAQTLDEWKLVIETVCLSGHPSNNEQHLRRQCTIRCSRQLLYVVEWFSDLNGGPPLLYSEERKGYEMAKKDCVKVMSPHLEAELELALCRHADVLLKMVVGYLVPEPARRDTTMHGRESSEYSGLFLVMETPSG